VRLTVISPVSTIVVLSLSPKIAVSGGRYLVKLHIIEGHWGILETSTPPPPKKKKIILNRQNQPKLKPLTDTVKINTMVISGA